MKKAGFLILTLIFANCMFGQLNQKSNAQKNYNNDCAKCADPWVGELYYDVWGGCASTSGGQNDLCNIYQWNNGHWSSYDNLRNIIRSKFTKRIAKGNVYIFVRTDAVNYGLGTAGHIGWGFQLSDGSFFAGSTENPFTGDYGKAWHVDAGKDNGFWSQRFLTEQDMLSYMKNWRGYHKYKAVSWPNPNLYNAKIAAENCKNRGFTGISNNCLDQTYSVLEALGVSGMPWKQTNPTPNGWFDEWFKNITGKGNNL